MPSNPQWVLNGIRVLILGVLGISFSFGLLGCAPADSEGGSASPSSRPVAELNPQRLYVRNCQVCHQANGQGGGPFPPLAGSEWVVGKEEILIGIILHGLMGPIEVSGKSYDGLMPSHQQSMGDAEIAAVLSFVRSQWGNDAPSVSEDSVRNFRSQYSGREDPWTAEELKRLGE